MATREVSLSWVEGMQFVAQGSTGHAIVMDASPDAGGHNTGARPMDVLLMAVLGCTAVDVISILKKKKQAPRGLRIFAHAEQAPEHPRYFTSIHLEYVAYGDVSPEALRRSVELSETKYCSAIATVRGVASMTCSCRVEPAEKYEG